VNVLYYTTLLKINASFCGVICTIDPDWTNLII
jgi:hypothetical protein